MRRKKTKEKSVLAKACQVTSRIGAVLTMLLAVILLMSAYGGHVDPRVSSKPALLTLGLPYLAAVMAVVALFWILFRQWCNALIALVALLASYPTVKLLYPMHMFQPKVKPEEEVLRFKVTTFNAKYFIYDMEEYWNNDNKAVDYLLADDADLIVIQEGCVGREIKCMPSVSSEMYQQLKSKYPYRSDGDYTNMSLLSKYPFTELKFHVLDEADLSSKSIYYKVKIKGRELYVVNAHLQSIHLDADDKEFFKEYTNPDNMKAKIKNSEKLKSGILAKLQKAFVSRADQADVVRAKIGEFGENVIVCGDFNDTPGSYAYRTIRGDDFRDAYQDCGFGPTITYHEDRFWLRIDHILYRGDMRAVDVKRSDLKVSDHYPMTATFVWNPKQED